MNSTDWLYWFRHAAPYINAHRGKTFVLMFGGEAIDHDNFAPTVHDIALLNSLGVKLVLVHGARPQISQQLALQGLQSRIHNNLRVTELEHLPAVMAATGQATQQVMARFSMGLPNSPMHGANVHVVTGNFVVAQPVGVVDGVDFHHTGEVRKILTHAIRQQLDAQHIVLLSCLGYSPTGEVFNLSAEQVATETAIALQADKLIFLGEEKGICNPQGDLLRDLTPEQAEPLACDPASRHRIDAAIRACRGGVARVHLIHAEQNGALLEELFTRDGAGTMISETPYEQIRQATIDDVGGILEIIRPLEENGILVRRSRELLETEIERFAVIERDNAIIGCAALYPAVDHAMGEIACVAVDENYRDGDRGKKLLAFLEARAREQGLQQLFVLTTKTAHWFMEQGFVPASLEALPPGKKELYNYQRNSRIFIKPL